jgi:phosphatidylglycerophosphate synthase
MRRLHRTSLTPADRVTLARAGLLVVVGLLVLARTAGLAVGLERTWAWAVLALAVPMLLLDAVDGAVARRTVATARGARLDMETDAAAVLVLAVAAAPVVGAWVLLAGALRYLFGAARLVLPRLRGDLPYSLARRVVAAVQGPALLVAVLVVALPAVPTAPAVLACAAALTALLWSFARDVAYLQVSAYREAA